LGSDIFERDPWNFNRKRHTEEINAGDIDRPASGANKTLSHSDGKSFQLVQLENTVDPASQNHDPNTAGQNHVSSHLISHEEWLHVSRATRNASWSAIFFLITTDVFGPLSVP